MDKDEQFFENIDFEDDSDISSVLIEKLKSDCDDNDGLILFYEETVEVLGKLYESFEKEEVSLDAVSNHPVIISIGDIVSNLKFVQDVSQIGMLRLQFMHFVSVIRMFIRGERTGDFDLLISSLKQMLPYSTAAGHDKYTVAIRKYIQDIKNLCPCLEKKCEEGSFTIAEMISLSGVVLLLTRSLVSGRIDQHYTQ